MWKRIIHDRRFWWGIGLLVAMAATAIEVIRGRNTNYFDYYDSTMMFWSGISSYTLEYAETRGLYFLYSPVFSTVFYPVFALPQWLGPFVWNIFNYCMFTLAIWTLPKAFAPYRLKIFLFTLSVVLQSVFCYQYNLVVCYIFVFAFNLLERGRAFWAVLLIMLSATTKVYGVVELALLFCYPHVWRNFGYAVACGAGFLLLPAINPSFDNVFVLYREMFEMIASHHSDADFIGILFARGLKPLLLPNYRAVQIIVFLLLAVLFFWRYKRWRDFNFRVQVLAVIMGYIILFSDSPETHTYVISLTGYAMAFFLMPRRTRFDWILFWLLFVNFSILPTDVLCPAWLHEYIHKTFWTDVYCMFIAWVMIVWRATGPSFSPSVSCRTVATFLLLATGATLSVRAQDKTYDVGGVKFVMKPVKGGTYLMGTTYNGGDSDEYPAHKVTVADFYIGECEVSQDLWVAVMGKNIAKYQHTGWPMESISYDDAHEFISKLNALTGERFRLPTEEEWEYAARGGNRSRGYLYAGGNDAGAVSVNASDGNINFHTPIRSKRPNELGLYDMSGGVWEWCENEYSEYHGAPSNFFTRLMRRKFHVIRGGSYANTLRYLRVSNRYQFTYWRRERTVGMRLAL